MAPRPTRECSGNWCELNSCVCADQELQRQKAEYDARRRRAEQLRLTMERPDVADQRSDLQQSSRQPTHDSRHTSSALHTRHTPACRSQSAMYVILPIITSDSCDNATFVSCWATLAALNRPLPLLFNGRFPGEADFPWFSSSTCSRIELLQIIGTSFLWLDGPSYNSLTQRCQNTECYCI